MLTIRTRVREGAKLETNTQKQQSPRKPIYFSFTPNNFAGLLGARSLCECYSRCGGEYCFYAFWDSRRRQYRKLRNEPNPKIEHSDHAPPRVAMKR
jgi:hypothetical protein